MYLNRHGWSINNRFCNSYLGIQFSYLVTRSSCEIIVILIPKYVFIIPAPYTVHSLQHVILLYTVHHVIPLLYTLLSEQSLQLMASPTNQIKILLIIHKN